MTSRVAINRNGSTPTRADAVEAVTQQSERAATTDRLPAPPRSAGDDGAGGVTVADRVVAEIVARAAYEVTGVHALVPRRGDPLLAWLRRLAGRDGGIPGVEVRVGRGDVTVGLAIGVAYGTSIPVVVDALRRYVTARVETLTGLAVRAVRIDVQGLAFPEDDPPGEGAVGRG